MKKPLSTLGLVALLPLCFVASCARPSSDDEEGKSGPPPVAKVTVVKVEQAEITRVIPVSGNVVALPNFDVKVGALVPGRIAQILAGEGDAVHKGQPLFRLDSSLLEDQVHQAEAQVEAAKANVLNSQLNLDRDQTLFNKGIAAGKEVEDARTQMKVSQGALQQAEAALSSAKAQVARANVNSPLDGVLLKRFASVGEQVDGSAGQPVVEVANLDQVEMQANVPAIYLSKVVPGRSFDAAVEGTTESGLKATIVAISPAVDPTSDVGVVRIRIANPRHNIRLGMYLTLQLPLETESKAIVVPGKAIYKDPAGGPRVFVVKGDTAEAVAVQLGIEGGGKVQVLSGVHAGDMIVLDGGYGLADKAKVEIKP